MKVKKIIDIVRYLETKESLYNSLLLQDYIQKPVKVNGYYYLSDEWTDNAKYWLKVPRHQKRQMTMVLRYGDDYNANAYTKQDSTGDKRAKEYVKALEEDQAKRDREYDKRGETIERFSPEAMKKIRLDNMRKARYNNNSLCHTSTM